MNAQRLDVLLEALKAVMPSQQVKKSVPMSQFTTLRLGGPADLLCQPASVEQLSETLKAAREQESPVTLIGNGSNLLVRDGGIRGLVIHLGEQFAQVTAPTPMLDGTFSLTAQAGATLQKLCNAAADNSLTGLEFAFGIPGTVGGAVYMNAGAYGGEICQVCKCVDVMDFQGEIRTFTKEEMGFSYRHSVLEEQEGIVVSADFELIPQDSRLIKEKMKELMAKRSASQPLDKPSAGSAFKRPVGGYAAALIDQAGLKGYQVGDAAISTKHAGFAVNLGQATAEDVKQLLQQVSDKVFELSGIRLEPEVRIW